MTARHSASSAHPASSPQTEERLRARLLEFHFEPNLSLDALVDAEGNQVRLIENRAPASMVTRYAEQMKAGAIFPAIVVNDRNEVIDGNTRRFAAAKLGRDAIAAYVCTDLTALQARALSVELNQCHGLSMTDEELHAFVVGAVQEGHAPDAKALARMTGVRSSTLNRWVAQASFEKRARQAGIPETQLTVLSQGCQAALNPVRLTPVLIELTALAAAAGMSASDVRRVASQANAAESEGDALFVVAAERDNRRDQIRSHASGFAARRSRGSRAAMHVGALLKMGLQDLIDVAPEKQEDAIVRLESLRDQIDEAIRSARAKSVAPAAISGLVSAFVGMNEVVSVYA
jgi:transposase-like protein